MSLRAVLIGGAIGLAFIFVVSLLSGPVLSQKRAARLSYNALAHRDIQTGVQGVDQDYFTDCTFLATLIVRSDNLVTNAIAMWRPKIVYLDPCGGLVALALHRTSWEVPDQAPYVNYPFGSRYLESFVLAIASYGKAKSIYAVASYAAVFALFLGARFNNRRMAYMLLPLYFGLAFMFAQQHFGHNLSHAPGFIFGFGILGFMLGARRLFESYRNRVSLFVVLGLLMAYFDLISGALLLSLCLGLVLNHLFYIRPKAHELSVGDYAKAIATQSLGILACFIGTYVFLTALHLALVSTVHGGALQAFRDGLGLRVGETDAQNQHVTRLDLIPRLWSYRKQLSMFGEGAATIFLLASLNAWLVSLTSVWLAVRNGTRHLLLDTAVIAVAALGVPAWYALLTNHSYVHAWFTVRFIALPASLGFVAAALVIERLIIASPFERKATSDVTVTSGATLELETAT